MNLNAPSGLHMSVHPPLPDRLQRVSACFVFSFTFYPTFYNTPPRTPPYLSTRLFPRRLPNTSQQWCPSPTDLVQHSSSNTLHCPAKHIMKLCRPLLVMIRPHSPHIHKTNPTHTHKNDVTCLQHVNTLQLVFFLRLLNYVLHRQHFPATSLNNMLTKSCQ